MHEIANMDSGSELDLLDLNADKHRRGGTVYQESNNMCVCVSVCVCCVYVVLNKDYTHTHTHTRMHARTHAHTHTHARTHTRTHTHTHMHMYTHTHYYRGHCCFRWCVVGGLVLLTAVVAVLCLLTVYLGYSVHSLQTKLHTVDTRINHINSSEPKEWMERVGD